MLIHAKSAAQAGSNKTARRMPMGAEVQAGGGVHFRAWAPASEILVVQIENSVKGVPLLPEGNGYFAGMVESAAAGTRYKLALDSGDFPDPASRFQPDGPHGASQVVDPAAFPWTDREWKGTGRDGQVIYEMHIGTFTPEGTWCAAAEQIEELAALGVTVLEVMPVADFPGRFGWGYDGVNLFAPTRLYGTPDEFRAFVDRAHAAGLGVILDVVYNHLGPDGNYLKKFSLDYFTDRYETEWGEPLNYDGPNSSAVREFFISNAGYWIDEFHLDGLRLDATQSIFDSSREHILAAIGQKVRAAARGRAAFIVAENEPQHVQLVKPIEKGGYGFDALWNDDFHHSAIVALSGRREAYYVDYCGAPQEFISALKYGYLYQGQHYRWQKQRRGTPSVKLHPAHFVAFTQNHDQVANSLSGQRCHRLAGAGLLRAMNTLLLLGPNTPMLFQGQEFAASAPFLYFADHDPELARAVAAGRRKFLEQFPSIASLEDDAAHILPGPEREETFNRCKLDFSDREKNREVYDLHRDLLALRRDDTVFRNPRRGGIDGAVLDGRAFVLRFFREDDDDRLLIVNFGIDLQLDPAPEPLLAPVEDHVWEIKWSSEHPRYGGVGTPPLETGEGWQIPGQSAVVLAPRKRDANDNDGRA